MSFYKKNKKQEEPDEDLISNDSFGGDSPIIPKVYPKQIESSSILQVGGCRQVYRKGMDPKIQIARGSPTQATGDGISVGSQGQNCTERQEDCAQASLELCTPLKKRETDECFQTEQELLRNVNEKILRFYAMYTAGGNMDFSQLTVFHKVQFRLEFGYYSQQKQRDWCCDVSNAELFHGSVNITSNNRGFFQYEHSRRGLESGCVPAWLMLYDHVNKGTPIMEEEAVLVERMYFESAGYEQECFQLWDVAVRKMGGREDIFLGFETDDWDSSSSSEGTAQDYSDQECHGWMETDAAAGYEATRKNHPRKGFFRTQRDFVTLSRKQIHIEDLLAPLNLPGDMVPIGTYPVSLEVRPISTTFATIRVQNNSKKKFHDTRAGFFVRLRDLLPVEERKKFDNGNYSKVSSFFDIMSSTEIKVEIRVTYYIEKIRWYHFFKPLLGIPDDIWKRYRRIYSNLFLVNRYAYFRLRPRMLVLDYPPDGGHPVQQAYVCSRVKCSSLSVGVCMFLRPNGRDDAVSHVKQFRTHLRHFQSWDQ